MLVTGTTGFLGKVWLAMVLQKVESIGRLYVLVRKKGLRPVQHRFEKVAGTSPVFKPLHEEHGAALGAWLAERIEVVEGDISLPDFGMDPQAAARIKRDVHLVVNCAGLVDFAPDIRLGLSSNVDGALHAAQFVSECDDASLLHVSTCYVAGERSGRIAEEIEYGYAPNGRDFDPAAELASVTAEIERQLAELDDPDNADELNDEVLEQINSRGLDASNATLVRNMTHRHRQQRVKFAMTRLGEERAKKWGWPNSYTYTKSISEQLLQQRAEALSIRYTVVRPAIVESAVSFPFPGWNEGFNTCGPLVYLLGTWFKHLPSKADTPFDIVPVDLVCAALTIAGAAVMLDEHRQVYHCGTSDLNIFTVGRATELTALGHRAYYRKHGENAVERLVLSRWDGVIVPPDHLLTIKNVRKTARGLKGLLRKLPGNVPAPIRKQADKLADGIGEVEKGLKPVQKACELFKPFIHDNAWIFETSSLKSHEIVEADLRFEPEALDWRGYWLDVHVPGLRKWCFPQLEGKPTPSYKPAHPFKLQRAAPVRARVVGSEG